MNTHAAEPTKNRRSRIAGKMTALMSAALLAMTLQWSRADIPDRSSGEFRGMYKIASSTDPVFPCQSQQEWFLDFGDGISSAKFSGNVAVSLRQNPKVRVRIMVWQFFPKQGNILIGNPYHEGAKNAVALGNWQLRATSEGIVFERGNRRIVLRRADPGDY